MAFIRKMNVRTDRKLRRLKLMPEIDRRLKRLSDLVERQVKERRKKET